MSTIVLPLNQNPLAGNLYCPPPTPLEERCIICCTNRWVTEQIKTPNQPQIPKTRWATKWRKHGPLVEVEAFSEEQELFIPVLQEVSGSGHFWPAGILAYAREVDLLLPHVVAQPDVVEVRRDVDQSVGHNRVPVLRQHFIYKELKPTGSRGTANTNKILFASSNNLSRSVTYINIFFNTFWTKL